MALAFAAACPLAPALGAVKADNALPLENPNSWLDTILPTPHTLAIFDSTLTTPNTSPLGASAAWQGIQLLNPAGDVTLNTTGATLTLGNAGINMSAATANLQILGELHTAASQIWSVGAGRSLSASARILSPNTLTLTGAGLISGVFSGTGTIAVNTAGTVTLNTAAMTSFGKISLDSGVALPASPNSLSPFTSLHFNGGTLDLRGHSQNVYTIAGASGHLTNSSPELAVILLDSFSGHNRIAVSGHVGFTVPQTTSIAFAHTANTYTGPNAVSGPNAGFTARHLANGGLPSSIGQSSSDPANLIIDGNFSYDGAHEAFTDRLFTVTNQWGRIAWNKAPVHFTNSAPIHITGTLTLAGAVGDAYSTFAPRITGQNVGLSNVGNWKITHTANSYTGPTIVGGTLIVDRLTNAGVDGPISGASAIRLSGTLRYTGPGDSTDRLFTGASGAIASSGAGPLNFTNTGTVTMTGSLTLTGNNTQVNVFSPKIQATSLVKAGTTTWRLTASHPYTGETRIQQGRLVLDFSSLTTGTSVIHPFSKLVLDGGELQIRGKPGESTVQSFNNTLAAGAFGPARLSVEQNNAASITLHLNAITRTLPATVDFVQPAAGAITTTTPNDPGAILGGWATANHGNSWATVSAGAIVPLTAFTQDTWAPAAHTDITKASQVQNATTHSLRFNTPAATTLALAGINTLSSGGILITPAVGAHTTSLAGGVLRPGPSNEFILHQHNTAAPFVLATSLADNGPPASLTKSGPGLAVLASKNAYTGNTHILEGTLRLQAHNALSFGSLTLGGTLDLNGFDARVPALRGTLDGLVTNSSATTSRLILSPVIGSTYRGSLSGPIDLHIDTHRYESTFGITLGAKQFHTGDTYVRNAQLTLSSTATNGPASYQNTLPADSHLYLDGGTLDSQVLQHLDNASARTGTNILITNKRLSIGDLHVHPTAVLRFQIPTNNAMESRGIYVQQLNGLPVTNGPSGILGGWALAFNTNGNPDINEWAVAQHAHDGTFFITTGATYVTTFSGPAHNTSFSGTLTAPVDAVTGSLCFSPAGATLTLSGKTTIATGGLLFPHRGWGSYQISGAAGSSLTSGTGQLYLHAYASVRIDAPLADNGLIPVGLSKSGPNPVSLGVTSTYSGPTDIHQGTLRLEAPHQLHAIAGAGTLDVASPLTSDAVNVGHWNIASTHTLRPQPAPDAASSTRTLTLSGAQDNWTGQLDLTSNTLIIKAGDPADKAAARATLLNQIRSGLTRGANGPWTGRGITSSSAAADPAHLAVGLFDNATLAFTAFRGHEVDSNSLLLTLAPVGDATLDGKVDAFDLNALAAHWQQPANALTSDGDFNHDGAVNAFDLNLLAANWQSGAPASLEASLAAFPSLPAPIPEPTSLLLLSPLLFLATRRRRTLRKSP